MAEDGEPEPPAGDEDEEPAEPAEPAEARPKRSGTVLVAPQKKGGEWKTATKIAVPPFLSIREPPF